MVIVDTTSLSIKTIYCSLADIRKDDPLRTQTDRVWSPRTPSQVVLL